MLKAKMKDLNCTRWVPDAPSVDEEQLALLVAQLRGLAVVLLTGAGCSTESGIPDYRGSATTERRARNPVQYQQFMSDERSRQRYWARSLVGWPRFRAALPNRSHLAARRLEEVGLVRSIITQNVDRLHQRAGSSTAIELHGALEEVRCLECGELEHRDSFQSRLLAQNPLFTEQAEELAPDGDVDLSESESERGRQALANFRIPSCRSCVGLLKPNVVFFGESVPRVTVDLAMSHCDQADALLVVGSSLAVYSGFRFVRRARERKKPVFVINWGPTRADDMAQLKVSGTAGLVLTRLVELI